MKIQILKSVIVLLLITTSLSSCNEDDDVASPPPPGLPELLYAEGGAPGFSSVSNTRAIESSREIFGLNGTSEVVKIKLSSLVVGAYTIEPGNEFTYTRPSTSSPWIAGTGTILITEKTDTTISGSFVLNSGSSDLGINVVNGSFRNVPIN